ncbi:hypothetical protein SRB5_24480 [Streptomyces sp. RB5]|uniref:DUF1349 domain-containing protein n=1 Tax=Streptomyces smaragdinus TaxID=2585196 RepID=A0A7K0CFR1_9ACTN|nr:DUF1349 domain-containing protein [Streptomyces smaragdinus]MQY12315.1 hypothetical protein [Streptomyces smaragdinus]
MRLTELPFALDPYGPKAPWTYADGVLTGTCGARQDRFVPPSGPPGESVSDAPRLLGRAPAGDFQLSARVRVDFRDAFDAGVLYLDVADGQWAKLCLERSPDRPWICTVVTRGVSDDANSFAVDGDTVWLRLSRLGHAFACHASTDGDHWTFVRTFALGTPEEAAAARVGFLVQAPRGEGCTVSFDRITFRPEGPKDLRDGS